MRLENSFVVGAAPERVWDFLLDVERVAPCIPGAELTGAVDEQTWKGKVGVKLGPVSLSFAGTVVREETDEAGRRVMLRAQGTETRGKGTASATVTSQLEPSDAGTRVVVVTDLQISGAVAQFGRGMLADVSQRFTDEFARCLAAQLAGSLESGVPVGGAPGGAPPSRPVSGLRLAAWASFRALRRNLSRILPFGSPRRRE